MKKFAILLSAALFIPVAVNGQAAFDLMKASETQLSGTSRYLSMAGAYGALGGDISAINHNPGGIGIYRSSDVGLTMNVNFMKSSTYDGSGLNPSDTKFFVSNVGYVGSMKVGNGAFKYFNWGFSFNRINSFHRRYGGYFSPLHTSITNHVANDLNRNNWVSSDLTFTDTYSPYYNSYAPWIGILSYQSYLINPDSDGKFKGLFGDGTSGTGYYMVDESGHTDEYNITLGGNFSNKLFWGVNFGITDMVYENGTRYGEGLDNANVANIDASGNVTNMTTGTAEYFYDHYLRTVGTGYNFKFGVIVKPINELRLGAAFSTPTFYDMKDRYKSYCDYRITPTGAEAYKGTNETGATNWSDETHYTMRTPWRFQVSAAAVLNRSAILSLDYEWVGYNTMRTGNDSGREYLDTRNEVKSYFKPSHVVRIGGEYRVTRDLSLRAGYSYQSSPVKDEAKAGNADVVTVSNNPALQYDNSNQYFTCGIGYRYKMLYVDAAYVHRHRKTDFAAFSGYGASQTMVDEVKNNDNNISLTLGVRF